MLVVTYSSSIRKSKHNLHFREINKRTEIINRNQPESLVSVFKLPIIYDFQSIYKFFMVHVYRKNFFLENVTEIYMRAVGEMVNVIHYFNCLSLIIRRSIVPFVLVENYFGVDVLQNNTKKKKTGIYRR